MAAALIAQTVVQVDPALLPMVTTVAIPLVVALIAKSAASPQVKMAINAVLVALVAALTAASVTDGISIVTFLALWVGGFVTSQVFHELFWKRLGISEIITNIAPNFGIGKPAEINQVQQTDNGPKFDDGPQPGDPDAPIVIFEEGAA